jgi:hypothetical protein
MPISAKGAIISGNGKGGVRAESGSTVILDGATITGNGGDGVSTDGTCDISIDGANISDNSGMGVNESRIESEQSTEPNSGSFLKHPIVAGLIVAAVVGAVSLFATTFPDSALKSSQQQTQTESTKK